MQAARRCIWLILNFFPVMLTIGSICSFSVFFSGQIPPSSEWQKRMSEKYLRRKQPPRDPPTKVISSSSASFDRIHSKTIFQSGYRALSLFGNTGIKTWSPFPCHFFAISCTQLLFDSGFQSSDCHDTYVSRRNLWYSVSVLNDSPPWINMRVFIRGILDDIFFCFEYHCDACSMCYLRVYAGFHIYNDNRDSSMSQFCNQYRTSSGIILSSFIFQYSLTIAPSKSIHCCLSKNILLLVNGSIHCSTKPTILHTFHTEVSWFLLSQKNHFGTIFHWVLLLFIGLFLQDHEILDRDRVLFKNQKI